MARADPYILRLSVAYTLLDGRRQIAERHLRAALALWRYAEASAAHIFGTLTGNRMAHRIYSLVKLHNALTRQQIGEALSYNFASKAIADAIDVLVRLRLVRVVRVKGKGRGRPAEWIEVI